MRLLEMPARKRRRRGIGRLAYPHALDAEWQAVCREVAATALKALLASVKAYFESASFEARAVRQDSYVDQVDLMFDAALKTTYSIWPEDRLVDLAQRQAKQVADLNKAQLTQRLAKVMTVGKVLFRDPWYAVEAQGFVRDNVALIKSIPEQAYTRARSVVMKAVRSGTRVEDLSREIQEDFGVTRSRANLIGRDQTTKFYGQVNKLRQAEAKVTKYIWRTVGDASVRETHAELEGQEFTWGDPPVTNDAGDTNEPGEDYQCRCTAEPVLEDDL